MNLHIYRNAECRKTWIGYIEWGGWTVFLPTDQSKPVLLAKPLEEPMRRKAPLIPPDSDEESPQSFVPYPVRSKSPRSGRLTGFKGLAVMPNLEIRGSIYAPVIWDDYEEQPLLVPIQELDQVVEDKPNGGE